MELTMKTKNIENLATALIDYNTLLDIESLVDGSLLVGLGDLMEWDGTTTADWQQAAKLALEILKKGGEL